MNTQIRYRFKGLLQGIYRLRAGMNMTVLWLIFLFQLTICPLYSQDSIFKYHNKYNYTGAGIGIGDKTYNYGVINSDLQQAGFPALNSIQPTISIGITFEDKRKTFVYIESAISYQQANTNNDFATAYSGEVSWNIGHYINKSIIFRFAPLVGIGGEITQFSGDKVVNSSQPSNLGSLANNISSFTLQNENYIFRLAFMANYFPKGKNKHSVLDSYWFSATIGYENQFFYQPWQTRPGQNINFIPFPKDGSFFLKIFWFIGPGR